MDWFSCSKNTSNSTVDFYQTLVSRFYSRHFISTNWFDFLSKLFVISSLYMMELRGRELM